MIQRGMNSSLIGLGFNLVLALFKCTTGFIGHSFALIADGIESLSDVMSSTVVYLGLCVAVRPPDQDHPYGHGKAEPVAAIIVSLALIVAGLVIGAESIVLIQTPHPLPEAPAMFLP
jgi:cation diffusion facilitator family transporter